MYKYILHWLRDMELGVSVTPQAFVVQILFISFIFNYSPNRQQKGRIPFISLACAFPAIALMLTNSDSWIYSDKNRYYKSRSVIGISFYVLAVDGDSVRQIPGKCDCGYCMICHEKWLAKTANRREHE